MTDAGGLQDDDLTTNAPAAGAGGGGLPPAPAYQEPVKAGDPATDTPWMDDDGSTPFGGVPGPSPELEAQWGPRVPAPGAAPGAPPDAASDAAAVGIDPFAHLAVLMPDVVPKNRRRVPLIAAVAAAVVLLAAGASAALLLPGDDDKKNETTVAGAASDDDDDVKATGSRFGEWGSIGARAAGANGTTTTTDPRTTTTTTTALPRGSTSSGSTSGTSSGPGSGSGSTRPTPTEPSEPMSAEAKKRLQEAVPAAQAFVDAFTARDCERVWSLMSADSQRFIDAFGQEDGQSGKDDFCDSIKNEAEMPASIKVIPPARAIGGDRAEVDLQAEVDGEVEVEPIVLVLEGGRWLIDLLGGEEMDDEDDENVGGELTEAQGNVSNGLSAEMVVYTDAGRFGDDLAELSQLEPSVTWRRGVANANSASDPGVVYVALANNGQVVCLSARDADGTLQMIKDVETADAGETTFATGTIPSTCDDKPLADSWH